MKNWSVRNESELLDKAFYASPCLMAISTISDGCYIKVNRCFEEITGFPTVEVIGRTSIDLNIFDTLTRNKVAKLLNEQGTLRNIEATFKTKDGDLRVGLFSAEIIIFNGQKCILSVANDVTEQKKYEKELFKLERMNLIGQMAASIGHEIRNPMTCVRGFLQMFSEKDELNSYREMCILMIEELDRANRIISEFLSLSKNKYSTMIIKNINSVIQHIAPLIIADGMGLNGTVKFELGVIPDIDLNEEEIRQLILNLTRNGFESMPEGGLLTIKTYKEDTDVILVVKDQGKGIEATILDKIGLPFFTTKEKGTGLGLAVCYSIAERHSAIINIRSEINGTEVIVRFNRS